MNSTSATRPARRLLVQLRQGYVSEGTPGTLIHATSGFDAQHNLVLFLMAAPAIAPEFLRQRLGLIADPGGDLYGRGARLPFEVQCQESGKQIPV